MVAVTRLGLYGGPRAPYAGFAAAPASAVAAVSQSLTEALIVTGSETITIELTNDTWVAAGATFNAQRQAIIDGLDAASSPALGWNDEVRDKEVVGAVVRISDTVVTITLTASALYDISSTETVTVTVPGAALTGAAEVTATPTFDVTAVAASGSAAKGGGRKKRRAKYPRRVQLNGSL